MTVESKVPYDTMSTTSVRSEPAFTKCCFCFPLRIGCFVLAYLNLFFNTIHTLALLTLTTYIGLSTHGFDHFDKDPHMTVHGLHAPQEGYAVPNDKPILNTIGTLLIVILVVNAAWVIVSVACLIGLHKKRPGPIRVYISCATIRLVLSLAGFIYLITTTKVTSYTALTHSIDLGLVAYYILVYYVYANRLEREQADGSQDKTSEVKPITDVAFICQPKADKRILVNV